MKRLRRGFFERSTPIVARELLGCSLVRVSRGRRLSGIIVETEAYRGSRDPASHAFRGKTPRSAVMFGEGGHAYVYFSYGVHWMLNVTTEKVGRPGATLIRAVEPVEGIEAMQRNRGGVAQDSLADGPGKLTKAMEIDKRHNGIDMVTSKELFLEAGPRIRSIDTGPRVGVSAGSEYNWRFAARGSRFVSRATSST